MYLAGLVLWNYFDSDGRLIGSSATVFRECSIVQVENLVYRDAFDKPRDDSNGEEIHLPVQILFASMLTGSYQIVEPRFTGDGKLVETTPVEFHGNIEQLRERLREKRPRGRSYGIPVQVIPDLPILHD